jgi:hypothetical protein
MTTKVVTTNLENDEGRAATMNEQASTEQSSGKATRVQRVLAAVFLVLGIGLCTVAITAEFIGLDLTPGFGAVQMLQFLLGISCLTLAGFLFLYTLRGPNAPRSLQADIGLRLSATGLVFMYVAGFADLIGIGTHVDPQFARPFAGPLQLGGILLGIVSVVAGMLLYHTSRGGGTPRSSMEFLVNGNGDGAKG